jgi:hypothetical protein
VISGEWKVVIMESSSAASRVPADDIRPVSMGVIWGVTFFVVTVVGGVLTPWDALTHLVENQGVGDEGANMLAFVGGFTLPLAAGSAILAFAGLRGAHQGVSAPGVAFAIAVVLVATGWLSGELGVGLAPDLGTEPTGGGIYAPLMWAISAYFSTYGWSLMICGIAVGIAAAVQAERWMFGDA